MTGRELLMALGEVDERFIEETAVKARPKRVKLWQGGLAAAVMSLLLAGCAYAVMQLQDLKLRDVTYPTLEGQTEADVREQLSLVGPAGSPGFLAAQEWLEFEENYDPDREIYYDALYHGTDTFPLPYSAYGCYTQEMADKVDEILAKYDLKPRGKCYGVFNAELAFEAMGIDGITTEAVHQSFKENGANCWEDGSFNVIGWITFPGRDGDWFELINVRKGVFSCSTETVVSIDNYHQWEYTMADGTRTFLAVSDGKGIILVEREDFYTSVVVVFHDRVPENLAERKTMLESMAETFDFSYQPGKLDTAALEAARQAEDAQLEANIRENHLADYRRSNYAANIYYFTHHRDNWEDMDYCLLDLDGDSQEELIVAIDGEVEAIITKTERRTELVADRMWRHSMRICEDGVVLRRRESGPCQEYTFWRMEGTELRQFECLSYHAHPDGEPRWTRNSTEELTEEAVMEIVNSHPEANLNWKPISQFPKD